MATENRKRGNQRNVTGKIEMGEAKTIQAPIVFKFDRDYQTNYANQVMVQDHPHEVIISFFAITVDPERPDKPQELEKKLKQSGLTAQCVTRVILAKTFFPEFIELLNRYVPQSTKKEDLKVALKKEDLKVALERLTKEDSEGDEIKVP